MEIVLVYYRHAPSQTIPFTHQYHTDSLPKPADTGRARHALEQPRGHDERRNASCAARSIDRHCIIVTRPLLPACITPLYRHAFHLPLSALSARSRIRSSVYAGGIYHAYRHALKRCITLP